MHEAFVNPFTQSLLNVFNMMIGIELEVGPVVEKIGEKSLGSVSGIMGMNTEDQQGSFSISFETDVALEATDRLFGERPAALNEEVVDLVGEITNMVAGSAKNILMDLGMDFGMASPKMLQGVDHIITHSVNAPVSVITFNSPFGHIFLEMSFNDLALTDDVNLASQ